MNQKRVARKLQIEYIRYWQAAKGFVYYEERERKKERGGQRGPLQRAEERDGRMSTHTDAHMHFMQSSLLFFYYININVE